MTFALARDRTSRSCFAAPGLPYWRRFACSRPLPPMRCPYSHDRRGKVAWRVTPAGNFLN